MRDLFLLTAKPTMYIANVDEDGFEDNPMLDAVRELGGRGGLRRWCRCAPPSRRRSSSWTTTRRSEFLADLGLGRAGAESRGSRRLPLLGLETYFTAGPKEVRAWTVPQGANAPQAAGVIHTDFERGFIRAEVIAYDDFIA